MRSGLFLLIVLVAPLLAGCVAQQTTPHCDDRTLVRQAVGHFARIAKDDGGIPPRAGAQEDPKTTAWVLLATALARRSGQEGGFDAEPHLDRLAEQLDALLLETASIDSAANNLSLARAAFQSWGRPPKDIPLQDPAYDTTTLAAAWDARYDPATGRYGTRLNEHLFGAFAAWIFDPPGARIEAMGRYVGDPTVNEALRTQGPDLYERDTWWSGYARSALGPEPRNDTLAERLDKNIAARTDQGTRGFAGSEPDASSTAAAILGRVAQGKTIEHPQQQAGITFLCGLQQPNGRIKFSHDRDFAPTKTTAEVVIALSLAREGIVRGT